MRMSAMLRPDSAVEWEPLHDRFPIFRTRFGQHLPPHWQEDITECVAKYREWRYLSGESTTSRQRQLGSAADFVVGVADGKVVARELPWLIDLYRGRLLGLANSMSLGSYVCSDDERSSINGNVLPVGSGYEWHVDTNPLTGLLFVTEHPAGSGGELVFRPDPVARPAEEWEEPAGELVVRPRSGDLLLFDAREAAHHVRQVDGPHERITIPMNYYFADGPAFRPDDLDDYLYGAMASSSDRG